LGPTHGGSKFDTMEPVGVSLMPLVHDSWQFSRALRQPGAPTCVHVELTRGMGGLARGALGDIAE